jgi:N-acetylgalactosamine-6-sulfatase
LAAERTDYSRFTVASGVFSPSRTVVITGHFRARYNIDGYFASVPSNAKRGMPD